MHNNGVQLVLRNKSAMSVAMQFLSGHASKIVLDDSRLTLNHAFQPANDAGTPGSTIEFRGEAPRLLLNSGNGTRCEQADAVQYKTAAEAAASGKTMKYIRYHHEPSNGMVLIMR